MSARRFIATTGPVVLTVVLVAVNPSPARAPEAAPSRPAVFALHDVRAPERATPSPFVVDELPPEESASTTLAETDLAALELDRSGVPARVLAAYQAATARLAQDQPGCRLRWELLAGIGRIESDHGRYRGAVVLESGRVEPAIVGPRLDGAGPFAVIRDTDGGRYDGDAEFDRAVGPMQFIPSTWARWGTDGDGDGVADPQDIDDAALSSGRYLCASGRRIDRPEGMIAAVFSYNHSYDYVRAVLTVAARYAGVSPLAFGTGLIPVPTPTPSETPAEVIEEAPVEAVPAPVPALAPAPPSGPAPTGTSTCTAPTGPVPTGPAPTTGGETGSGTGTASPSPTASVAPTDDPAPDGIDAEGTP
jgi:hypothetical protein